MKPEVIFEHPSLILTHYPNGNFIYEEWHGYTSRELFNELLTEVLTFLVKKKSNKLILDVRDHPGLSPEGQKDASNRCVEWAKQNGQLWHATILPPDVFSKFSVQNFGKRIDADAPVINRYFETVESATAWMEQTEP
jgi:hypothetical protein